MSGKQNTSQATSSSVLADRAAAPTDETVTARIDNRADTQNDGSIKAHPLLETMHLFTLMSLHPRRLLRPGSI